MPGTSRHHWGTDIDLNSLENSYFEVGEGLKVYQWLLQHAHEFGFCQPYTSKATGRTGYEEEKWHWSYTPLSVPLLQQYMNTITLEDISGFQGSETAAQLDVINTYVAGVHCK
jgi:LAS superfamily LD-carboxypeptidase LdcB